MASKRRDDLAKRLAQRLDQAPPKGRAMSAPASEAGSPTSKRPSPKRAPSKQPSSKRAQPKRAQPKRPPPNRPVPEQAVRKAPTRSRSTAKTEGTVQHAELLPARPRRGSTGTVLRGHLVPETIHGDARRRKAMLRASTGVRITWDDVMCDGVARLVQAPGRVPAMIDDLHRSSAPAGRRRLVQATMSTELDQRLVELHLDLADQAEANLTYEQLWAAAMMLWLESSDDLVDS